MEKQQQAAQWRPPLLGQLPAAAGRRHPTRKSGGVARRSPCCAGGLIAGRPSRASPSCVPFLYLMDSLSEFCCSRRPSRTPSSGAPRSSTGCRAAAAVPLISPTNNNKHAKQCQRQPGCAMAWPTVADDWARLDAGCCGPSSLTAHRQALCKTRILSRRGGRGAARRAIEADSCKPRSLDV